MDQVKIVLLGSLPKGDKARQDWDDWKAVFSGVIKKKIPNARFIHGDSISDSEGSEVVVGHDLVQIKQADICVVDARTKVGAGSAQEMVLAKYYRKPVVTVIPKDSHHRRTNVIFHGVLMEEWVHPFLMISSDYVAESIEAAADWIKGYLTSPQAYEIKDITVFDRAVTAFETRS